MANLKNKIPNRLVDEKSPYLLQHAHNPVDWYPWGKEAFDKAQAEDKPIFLSIGYSTCHWCHVMERESFEDEEVAGILNKHFVAIKVDREERPDIDTIYMSVCQALTGHGGWPLTVFLAPDRKPFYAGTYFPKESRYNMPGLLDILQSIIEAWQTKKEDLLEAGTKITQAVQNELFAGNQGAIKPEILDQTFEYFSQAFDAEYGGFGPAPKFPSPHNLSFLMRYWKLTGEKKALEMVKKTLDAMYRGGIYDHIGFGFTRYSTDRKWLVPHFEKMLYDNALLALTYGEAYQITKKPEYAKIIKELFTYILRDMTSPEGAFYSAEDADSEGEEGKFYVWTPEEVKEVLGAKAGENFCQAYDITSGGNFEGKSIPNLIKTGFVEGFVDAKQQLFQRREMRVHPYKDDKILTSWNGLMITALAFNARALNKPKFAQAAEKAAQFILQNLRRSDGRLLARYRDGEAAYLAYVDDYAFLTWGLLELYQATYQQTYLAQALELNQDLIKYFWDAEEGGLFQYGHDAEQLITRPKETYDGALPSGNSVATLNFLRLARLTGNLEWEEKAQQQFKTFSESINASPAGHTHFLMAFFFNQVPTSEVNIIGNLKSPATQEMLQLINTSFLPEVLLAVKPLGQQEEPEQTIPSLNEREAVQGKATAYVCQDFACQAPTTDLKELEKLLPLAKGQRILNPKT